MTIAPHEQPNGAGWAWFARTARLGEDQPRLQLWPHGLGEAQKFVEILPDDRIKDIEVEFSVLVDSEVAEANHSLQAVTKSGAIRPSRTRMANESQLSFGMPRWRLRIAMLARSMATSQARMTLRIAASCRLWLVRISVPAAAYASRARATSAAVRLFSVRRRRSLTVPNAGALKVFQQVAYFFAVALIAAYRGAFPFQDSVWLRDIQGLALPQHLAA